jgi:SAM-dependent methyltransferase
LFNSEHQAKVLLEKLKLKPSARMLDYGCAKSATYRMLSEQRPDLDLHLFDVTDRFTGFWSSFTTQDRCAIGEIPEEWNASFDVVTSFFAFEHIATPVDSLRAAVALLKPDGRFYCVVPNVLTNTADLVVVDHENHFTEASIRTMVREAGLSAIEIDGSTHRGAFVIIGTKFDQQCPLAETEPMMFCGESDVAKIGEFWSSAAERIRAFEATLGRDDSIAVYGAGFYGTFITAALAQPKRVRCCLDQNPFLQGRLFNERWPVIHPAHLPSDVTVLLVGLNPTQARSIIDSVPSLHRLRAFFL